MSAQRLQAARRLLLATVISHALATTAWAAPEAGASAGASGAAAGATLDTVIVTGSRVGGRTVKSSEAPIDIISGEEVQKASKTDLLEALQVLVPSLTLPSQPSNGLASRVVRGAYLRGLSPGHTLVLVNGKRRHATASVGAGGSEAAQPADLGLIPTAAIERIEVLRDGASAIYGSDAIAGVINIITRKDAEGGSASLRAGQFFDGEGDSLSARIGQGFALGEEGHLYTTLQYDQRERTYRGAPAPEDMLYYFPLDANGNQVLPAGSLSSPRLPAGASPDPREASRDPRLQQINGQTPYTTIATTVDAGLPINDRIQAYALLTAAWRDAESFNSFRLPVRNENVRAIYPDGYSPVNDQRERDYELQSGLKGLGEQWSWELGSGFGRNFAEIGSHDTVNPSFGLDSQTRFHIGNLDYKAWTSNLDLRRSFED
jgi:iron complex outermembrane receptor protein